MAAEHYSLLDWYPEVLVADRPLPWVYGGEVVTIRSHSSLSVATGATFSHACCHDRGCLDHVHAAKGDNYEPAWKRIITACFINLSFYWASTL